MLLFLFARKGIRKTPGGDCETAKLESCHNPCLSQDSEADEARRDTDNRRRDRRDSCHVLLSAVTSLAAVSLRCNMSCDALVLPVWLLSGSLENCRRDRWPESVGRYANV